MVMLGMAVQRVCHMAHSEVADHEIRSSGCCPCTHHQRSSMVEMPFHSPVPPPALGFGLDALALTGMLGQDLLCLAAKPEPVATTTNTTASHGFLGSLFHWQPGLTFYLRTNLMFSRYRIRFTIGHILSRAPQHGREEGARLEARRLANAAATIFQHTMEVLNHW